MNKTNRFLNQRTKGTGQSIAHGYVLCKNKMLATVVLAKPMARLKVFLASSSGPYDTGSKLFIHGGWRLEGKAPGLSSPALSHAPQWRCRSG